MPFYELSRAFYKLFAALQLPCYARAFTLLERVRAWVGAWAMRGAYDLNA